MIGNWRLIVWMIDWLISISISIAIAIAIVISSTPSSSSLSSSSLSSSSWPKFASDARMSKWKDFNKELNSRSRVMTSLKSCLHLMLSPTWPNEIFAEIFADEIFADEIFAESFADIFADCVVI